MPPKKLKEACSANGEQMTHDHGPIDLGIRMTPMKFRLVGLPTTEQNLAMTSTNVPAGVDFVDYLNSQEAACDVFLAVKAGIGSMRRTIVAIDDSTTRTIT